jgi:hypothetical protein
MPRLAPLIAIATVLTLSIISTTFVLLTLTSPQWSSQSYFFALNGQSDGSNHFPTLCTARRSPFYRCGIPEVAVNKTCKINDCSFYKPYGYDKTSCRSGTEYGSPEDDNRGMKGLLGSSQECQQGMFQSHAKSISTVQNLTILSVHYAGNLQIAASVFITLGLLLSLILSLFSLKLGSSDNHHVSESAAKDTSEKNTSETTNVRSPKHHKSRLAPFVSLALIISLSLGALLQFLAQFFGILGLTVNATPNAGRVTKDQYKKSLNNFSANQWVVDKALSSYATVAWTSAIVGALVVAAVFRTPRFSKVL